VRRVSSPPRSGPRPRRSWGPRTSVKSQNVIRERTSLVGGDHCAVAGTQTHVEALLPVTPRSTVGGIRPRIAARGAETRRPLASSTRRSTGSPPRTGGPIPGICSRRPAATRAYYEHLEGSQVRWRKNLCAPCNNTRSQRFDSASDRFEAFVTRYADDLGRWHRLDWTTVYGEECEQGARDLARYFAKQLGYMVAGQDLDVPQDVVDFLNGADRCPSVAFMIYLNWPGIDGHRMMRRHGWDEGLTSLIGLLESHAWANGEQLTRIDYGYHIGYVWILLDWTKELDRTSWFEHPSTSALSPWPCSLLRWRQPDACRLNASASSARVPIQRRSNVDTSSRCSPSLIKPVSPFLAWRPPSSGDRLFADLFRRF
jgi:hypothetical protein